MPYTTIMDTLAAIIPVAGLSSRMGSFKPLLELNGFPLIKLTLQSAFDGGVQYVCLVTGKNAEKVRAALIAEDREAKTGSSTLPLSAGGQDAILVTSCPQQNASLVTGLEPLPCLPNRKLLFIHNAHYERSDMLQSIKSGLKALLESDDDSQPEQKNPSAVFILPGDMPAISPRTFVALQKAWELSKPAVIVPLYEGRRGHPLLISDACFDTVLTSESEGGLQEALAGFEWTELAVDDPGILLDADTPEAFAELALYLRKVRGVSHAIAEELFALYQTPSNVREHTRAVAEVAHRMAISLNVIGTGLDSELCRSGGELHDLNRLEPDHSTVAARHLRELGYEALAAIVAAHDRELLLTPRLFTEANLVFVADKLVKETTLVSITNRYAGAVKRFPPSTKIGKLIQKDSESTLTLLRQYVELTGDEAIMNGTEGFIRESRDHASS